MNIGIDSRLTSHSLTGIGSYTRSLVKTLLDNKDTELNYTLYGDRKGKCQYSGARSSIFPLQRRNVWNQLIPAYLLKDKIDIYHATSTCDVPMLKLTKLVSTVHDMVPLLYPELYSAKHSFMFKSTIKRVLAISDVVITVSEASKKEILSFYPEYENKIVTIHIACDPCFLDGKKNREQEEKIRRKYTEGQPFCFYLGTHEPKKNIGSLIRAFKMVIEKEGSGFPYKLLIGGKKDMHTTKLQSLVNSLKIEPNVVFTDYIPDHTLPGIYKAAELFIFPSIHEGFGIPVLESMSCGTPVLCSDLPALREVAGAAGAFFESNNTESLAEAILSILMSRDKIESMQKRSLKVSSNFSWSKTAKKTIEVYKSI